MKKWSSQWTQFLQLRKEAWKKCRTSTGFESVTSRYRCDALPTELWSHWRWEQVNCGFICCHERNDIWNKSYMNCGNEMKMKKWSSKWTQFMQLRKEAWSLFCSTEITSVMSTRVNEWMNNKSNANPAPEKSLPYSMLRTIIGPAGRPVYSANRKQYHVVYVKELNNRLQNIFQFDWVSLSIQQVSRTSWLDLLRATT